MLFIINNFHFLYRNIHQCEYLFKVKIIDNSGHPSDSQNNTDSNPVDCNSATSTSTGTDNYEFMCDSNLAASSVQVEYSGSESADLAEVVIVGFLWGEFLLLLTTNKFTNYHLSRSTTRCIVLSWAIQRVACLKVKPCQNTINCCIKRYK